MQLTGEDQRLPEFGERFVTTALLGAGAFGRVYRAYDKRYRSDIAIKVLSALDSEALRLFKHEFRAITHVNHANLVMMHELHARRDAWFITMEYVQGSTLSAWARMGPRSTSELRGALLQMASGVSALHESGLVHRDLKPSNVLVAQNGRVVVSDFGMVGILDSAGRKTDDRAIGSVAYSAPELWTSGATGPASDWYAFGMGMYELLTGKRPFDGEVYQSIGARTREDGPSPRAIAPDVPEDLDDLCTRLLKRDPAARPTAAECLATLGGERHVARRWVNRSAPFVAREEQLASLEASLDRARSQGTRLVLVSGVSGIGKSALVERYTQQEAQRGAMVLRSHCHPHDALRGRALDGVVDELVRHLRRVPPRMRNELLASASPALARMFPTLRDVLKQAWDSQPQGAPRENSIAPELSTKLLRQAALGSLAQLLSRFATLQPLIVVVEDLHWADAESGEALAAIVRLSGSGPGPLIVGTLRQEQEQSSACVRALRAALPDAATLEVPPLDPVQVRDLLHASLGAEASAEDLATAERTAIQTGQGNPYIIQELASSLRDGVQVGTSTDPVSLLDEVVLWRVADAPSSARQLLDVLALAEEPLAPEVALAAAAVPESDYLASLALLRARRLVTPRLHDGQQSLEPYHGRVREALERAMSHETQRAIHLALAGALEASGGAPDTIARHYLEGGDRKRAVERALRAAQEAKQALAFERCAQMLRLALSIDVIESTRAHALRVDLAEALANAGRGPEAAEVFLELAGAAPRDAASFERRAAEQLLFSGHIEEGIAVLDRALGRVDLRLPRSRALSVARVLWAHTVGPARRVLDAELVGGEVDTSLFERIETTHAATVGLTMTDPLASAAMQAEHLDSALRSREPRRIARALAIHLVHTAGGWYDPARTARIRAVLDGLLRSSERDEDDAHPAPGLSSAETAAHVALARAGAAWMEGSLPESLREADRALGLLRRSQCVGMQWHLDTHHVMELEVLETMGDWDGVAARLGAYLEDARQRGDRFLEATLRVRFRPLVLLAADDPRGARAEIDRAERLWAREDFDLVSLYAAIRRAWCALYDGDAHAAHALMEDGWRKMRSSLLVRVAFYRDLTMHSRAATLLAFAQASPSSRAGRAAAKEGAAIARELASSPAALPRAMGRLRVASAAPPAQRAPLFEAAAVELRAAGAELHASAAEARAHGTELGAAHATLRQPARVLALLAP